MTKNLVLGISILLNLFLVYSLLFRATSKPDYTGSDNQEVLRVTSPDSAYDVVCQAHSEGGALGSLVYQAYLVPTGKKPVARTQFLEGVHVDSCSLSWLSDSVVGFHYKSARILDFNNTVWIDRDKNQGKRFEIRLDAHD